MTTYKLDGFANYYDNTLDQDVGGDYSGISLELVVADNVKSFSYVVLPLAPGDSAPDDLYVDTDLDDYNVRLNGETITQSNQFDETVFKLNWTDAIGGTHKSFIYLAEVLDITVPGLGLVDASYVFQIGGDALPSFSTHAQFMNFLDNSLKGLSIPGGTYGPNTDIQLTSLGATVTQNDVIVGTKGADTFDGGLGNDKISGLGGNDTLIGAKGNDTLKGGKGADKLMGKIGKDTLNGEVGNDKLFGDAGNDKLNGALGRDTLNGGAGSDVLNGAKGNDILIGGTGSDEFVFQNKAGNDLIRDFNATNNQEDINLKAVTSITGFLDLKKHHMSQVGTDVVIDDDNGTVITLQDVTLSDLGKADFIF